MRKNILPVFAALSLSLSAFAQGFFENVPFIGAFPQSGTSYTTTADCDGCNYSVTGGNWAIIDNGSTGWVSWTPKTEPYPDPTETKSGDITSDVTWSGNIGMSGTIHVKSGATLNITAGTVIRCQSGSTLIVAKGGKINAVGTKDNPIVFTSSKAAGQRAPGDWAGILIIGNAQTNTTGGKRQYEALPNDPLAEYGGGTTPNNADNSGVMQFVRIEFAGYNYLPDQELNGLTLGAVGSGTKINFIQVSYARDDSFEWFGGTSNHKYLIAFGGVDDDFDMDEGYRGNVQFILGVRDHQVYETAAGGTSNGFEHDNNTGIGTASAVVPGDNNPQPSTRPVISNATMIGPWVAGRTASQVVGNKFGRAFEMRSAVETFIYNSVGIGYATLVQAANASPTQTPCVQSKLRAATMEYKNLKAYREGSETFFTNNNSCDGSFSASYFTSNGNAQATAAATTLFTQPNFASSNPDFTTTATLASGGDFSGFGVANNVGAVSLIPSFSLDKNGIAFGTKLVANVNEFAPQTIAVNVRNVTSVTSVSITAPANFSVVPSSITLVNGSFTGTVSVSYSRTTGGSDNGFISFNAGAQFPANFNVAVSGAVVAPAEPILGSSLENISLTPLENLAPFTSAPTEVVVSGRLLVSNVTVTAPAGFEVSSSIGGTYGSSVTLARDASDLVSTSVFVRLNTSSSASLSGNLTISATDAQSVNVALSASTRASYSGSATAVTIDYNRGIVTSTVGIGFNIRGTRLPASTLITAGPDLEVSVTSSSTGYASSQTLNFTNGVLTSTSSNVWVRYVGTTAGTAQGIIVGYLTVAGITAPLPVTIRLIDRLNTNLPGWIISNTTSNVVTGLGVNFTTVLGNTFLYSGTDQFIGEVTSVTSDFLYLRNNALVSSPLATFAGTIKQMAGFNEVTGVGTNFTLLKPGMALFDSFGQRLYNVVSVTSDTLLTVDAPVSTTTVTGYQVNAARYRRAIPTLSVSPSAPLTFDVIPDGNGGTTTQSKNLQITGANHNVGVVVRINPGLTASGYMFELTTVTGNMASYNGMYNLTIMPNLNGSINATLTIKYDPNLIKSLSLPGLNVLAAHSTELEILANNRTSVSSSAPLESIAYNLRGNAQPNVSVNVTKLPVLSAYKGVPSASALLKVTTSRQGAGISVAAPANFQLSFSNDFTGASNSIVIPTVTGYAQTKDVFVRYFNTQVANENGSITIASQDGNIAAITVDASGRTVDFTSFINMVGSSTTLTVAGAVTSTVTVEGTYLVAPMTVTATGGFEFSQDGTTFATSLVLTPDPSDFGNVDTKVLTVRYPTTATGVKGAIKAEYGTLDPIVINLTTFDAVVIGSVPFAKGSTSLVVYPNPSSGFVHVSLSETAATTTQVLVYNLSGVVVKSATINAGATSTSFSELTPGMYVLSVITDAGRKSVKLVVE